MPEQKLTGYPSIDKPWLKYYSEEAINAPLPECTIYEYLWENNKNHLDDIALNYYNRKISYRKLFENIDITAKAFSAIGIKENNVVAIFSVTTPEVIYSVYALNMLGAISNIIDPRTNMERIKVYIESSKTTHIIAIDKCIPKIQALKEMGFQGEIIEASAKTSLPYFAKIIYSAKNRNKVTAGLPWNKFQKLGTSQINVAPYKKGRVATIVYTGGTTGIPKGAMLSDDTLNIIALQYRLLGVRYKREQAFLNIMPPFIAYGIVCGIHMPLSIGLTNVIIPLLEAEKLPSLIKKHKPMLMLGVPMHYEIIANSKITQKLDFSFFEIPGCGGDGINSQIEKQINDFLISHGCKSKLTKGYGMTELGSAAITCIGNINKPGSVGIPHCKTIVSVFKPGTNNEVTYETEGEICISTPAMMNEYVNNKEETKRVIRHHSDGSIWIHSGDIGYMDSDGFVFVKGRTKRMIIRPDGHNVWPSQIEDIIMQHPSVSQAVVVGAADKKHKSGRWPVAFVVLKDNSDPGILYEIKKLCLTKLPPRDTADVFYEIEKLPMTDVGKIDYRALEKQAEEMSKI